MLHTQKSINHNTAILALNTVDNMADRNAVNEGTQDEASSSSRFLAQSVTAFCSLAPRKFWRSYLKNEGKQGRIWRTV